MWLGLDFLIRLFLSLFFMTLSIGKTPVPRLQCAQHFFKAALLVLLDRDSTVGYIVLYWMLKPDSSESN